MQYLFPVMFDKPHGNREIFLNDWFGKHMKVCSGRLTSHGKPFIAGTDRPTIADFKMFAAISIALPMNTGCKVEEEVQQEL